MYGPTSAYSDQPMQKIRRTFLRDNLTMRVDKYPDGRCTIKTIRELPGGGRITEYLLAIDVKRGIFELTWRACSAEVPMSMVAGRQTRFPLGCTVDLRNRDARNN